MTLRRATEKLADITLIEDEAAPGRVVVHRPDCPMVAAHRAQGRLVLTMFGVTKAVPASLPRHECLL